MHFDLMNIILSYSDHQHVSATYVAIFRVVVPSIHCANYTVAHQSGSQSTTYSSYVHHSTETHPRHQLLTSIILCSSLFYHLTKFYPKLHDLSVVCSRHTINTHVFCTDHPEDGHTSGQNLSVGAIL